MGLFEKLPQSLSEWVLLISVGAMGGLLATTLVAIIVTHGAPPMAVMEWTFPGMVFALVFALGAAAQAHN